jgi:hypothetical protein
MEYCSGGDLTNYIKKRGRVEGLEYVPYEGAAPQYYPHPRTGGLDEVVVRSFLRQLGMQQDQYSHPSYQITTFFRPGIEVLTTQEPNSSGYQATSEGALLSTRFRTNM